MRNSRLIILIATIITFGNNVFASDKLDGTPIGSRPDLVKRAFDGDPTTSYLSNESSYSWVGLDLGERYVISEVRWRPTTGSPRAVLLGVFQGANEADFSDAIPIYMIDNVAKTSAEVNCSRGFRYVRYVGPADSYCLVAEIEFYGTPGKGDDKRLWQITNLPTVAINTVNGEIPYDKEHDISSTVIIISDCGTKVLEKSETGIRERGNVSRSFPKKPWRIKFDKKQNVLDAPAKAKKWTLINNYGDKTLMRNMIAFDIARKLGMEWVPYCHPVDVVLNGEYKGCYQLCDQVEVNEGRVNIDEMEPEDIEGDALSGGYLIEVDGYAYDEPVYFVSAHYGIPVTIKSPDDDKIVDAQRKYIEDYFNMLEQVMKDTDPVTGYRSVFDNRSFIQHMLVNEVAGNTDSHWSTYMYKRRNDPKIYTGPVWDFDIAFNNDYRTYPVTEKSGDGYLWNSGYASGANGMIYFSQRILLKDEQTPSETLEVWREARRAGLSVEWLHSKVDEYAQLLDASQRLNFTRWPILGQQVHMNPSARGTYLAECNAVKDYLAAQMAHLDKVVGYDPMLDEEAAVAEIEIEGEIAPEYFNLNGLRVSLPLPPGIYIERVGSDSRKIIIN